MTNVYKGRNQYVIPDAHHGWCVIDEMDREILHHFNSLDQALQYAHQLAGASEGVVLMHENPDSISCASPPQESILPDQAVIEEE
jgi:hypothetical protein